MIKNICFIVDGYPSDYRIVNAFVETLVNQMVDFGVNCIVISPQSINRSIKVKTKLLPKCYQRKTPAGNIVNIYSPKYFSLSAKKLLGINTAKITLLNFRRSAEKIFKRFEAQKKFDIIYGHFIFPSALTTDYLAKKYNLPSFFAYGENTTYSINYFGNKKTMEGLRNISGVISVSSLNKNILIKNNIVPAEKISIFPNAIDTRIFYPRNKLEMRKKYSIDTNAFVVVFVGRFLDVKGALRLSSALKEIKLDDIYAIFIGEGKEVPNYKNIIFSGTLDHELIPEYLSMSDVFVLPTLAEGCCNAIIEAMACGLPIISSNLPFNDDILDDSCSIRINPNSIEEIKNAIILLKENTQLRASLAEGALNMSSKLNIANRTKNILSFIDKIVKDK